jgi:hypothetical protein
VIDSRPIIEEGVIALSEATFSDDLLRKTIGKRSNWRSKAWVHTGGNFMTIKRARWVLFGAIITLVIITAIFAVFFINPKLQAQYYKSRNSPQDLAEAFFYALYKDDLGFAKELVIPDQRHRIDEWKIATKHKAIVCSPYQDPEHWIDPYAGGIGGGGFDGQNYKVDFDYFCYNGDQGELDIEDITI